MNRTGSLAKRCRVVVAGRVGCRQHTAPCASAGCCHRRL